MKQIKLLLGIAFCFVMCLQTTYAQNKFETDNAKESKSASEKNWYFSVGAGPNLLMANQDGAQSVFDRMTYGAEISIGKWFGSTYGARLQFHSGSYRGFNYLGPQRGSFVEHASGSFPNPEYYPRNWVYLEGSDAEVINANSGKFKFTDDGQGFWQDFNSTSVFLDITVDMIRLFNGSDREDHSFNVMGFLGVGFLHNVKSETNPTTNVAGFRFGGRLGYDFSKGSPWSLFFEGNGIFLPEEFDGYIGDRGFDTNANTMLGLQYKF
ncbi:MAG: hypothetical protein LBR67_05820 [Dysgonamonadaceae bacterium]|jgi:hypothetical protein|nr:hypothetical protein [Dysgonamonadaceae bacterium]